MISIAEFHPVAIAVRIVLFKRFQHLVQFIRRFRHVQIELLKPWLINPHLLAHGAVIDIAVDSGYRRLNLRVILEHLLCICPLLFYQLVQREKGTLRAVDHLLRRRNVQTRDHIGIILAGKQPD